MRYHAFLRAIFGLQAISLVLAAHPVRSHYQRSSVWRRRQDLRQRADDDPIVSLVDALVFDPVTMTGLPTSSSAEPSPTEVSSADASSTTDASTTNESSTTDAPSSTDPISEPPSTTTDILSSPSLTLLPSDIIPSDILPSDILPSDILPSDILPSDILPSDILPSDILPSDILPSDILPSDVLPSDILPSDILPSDVVPSDVLPSVTIPSEVLPSETPSETAFPPSDTTVDFPPSSTDPPPPVSSTDPPPPGGPDSSTIESTAPPPSSSVPVIDPPVSSLFPSVSGTIDDGTTIPTSEVPATTPTQWEFLTASSLLFASITDVPATITQSDPDAPTATPSLDGASNTGAPKPPSLPPGLPTRIFPPNGIDPDTAGDELNGFILICILFDKFLPWPFVAQNSQSAAQLLNFMPQIISNGLSLPQSDVKTFALQAWTPQTYTGNPDDLRTLFLAYIPESEVSVLTAQLLNTRSPFYTSTGGAVAKDLVSHVVGTFDPRSLASTGGSNSDGSGNPAQSNNSSSGGVDNSTRNAIIGVCSVFGAIVLGLLIWWIVRQRQLRQESQHRRLSYNSDTPVAVGGMGRSYGAQGTTPNAMGERRDSFFFAADSLRGHSGGGQPQDDDVYVSRQPSTRRAPIQGQAISQPILLESSMGNW